MEISEYSEQFKRFLEQSIAISKPEFEKAIPFFTLHQLKKGDAFTEQGKISRELGYLASGIMRAWYLDDGKEVTTCICTEDSFVNSAGSFITQTPSPVTIEALTPSVVLAIEHAALNRLYRESVFWAQIGRIIAEKEYLWTECRSRCYSRLDAEEKYLSLLREHPQLINTVPLQYIASFLGISPETLSRIRKKTARRIS